jgi:hypothetical protein
VVIEFTVESGSLLGFVGPAILVVTGAIFFLLGLVARGSAKKFSSTAVVMLVIGLIIIGLGGALGISGSSPSKITVGNRYVFIQSPPFTGAGDANITSSQIASAYVGSLGSGNLTLSKQHGTNRGDTDIGIFTVNGARAVVVSDNSTVLVIDLESGSFVILGTSDTSALVSAFSQSVYPVGTR